MLHLAPWSQFGLVTHSPYSEQTHDVNINIYKQISVPGK